ncbi:uncharacterized protein [Eurosta solidaginis]|uniref:uncharacterized protein n=1 Tax=Eurosta solidaginis TaxID=178769 RepID=UPI003530D6BB
MSPCCHRVSFRHGCASLSHQLIIYIKMPANKTECSIKKKKIVKASRRWTYREIIKILRYAVNTVHMGNFEKPTARQYYIKLAKDLSIDVAWHLVYYKIVNLQKTYDRAEQWLKTTTTASGEEGAQQPERIRDQLLRFCPHYDMLKIISVQKRKRKPQKDKDANNVNSDGIATDCDYEVSNPDIKTESIHLLEIPDNRVNSAHNIEPPFNGRTTETPNLTNDSNVCDPNTNIEQNFEHLNTNANNLSGNYNPNMIINQLLQLEESRERNRIQKLNNDLELQEKKLSLEERRLDLEEKKIYLEERKADRDYELRKMEIEMKERLARYEYELKYGHHN